MINPNDNIQIGDLVYVDIHRGVYWVGEVCGRFAGYTKSGRIRVTSGFWPRGTGTEKKETRAFLPENVTKK